MTEQNVIEGTRSIVKSTKQEVTTTAEPTAPLVKGDHAHILSSEETRDILTPFAFEIDKSLFGSPLARPWKRGVALLIDMLCVAMLSGAPGELLAFVIAITFFRIGSKKRAEKMGKVKGAKRRGFMRFIGAFIILLILLEVLPQLFSDEQANSEIQSQEINQTSELSGVQIVQLTAVTTATALQVSKSDCTTQHCWFELLSKSLDGLKGLPITNEAVADVLDSTLSEIAIPFEQQEALEKDLLEYFRTHVAEELSIEQLATDTTIESKSITPLPSDFEVNTPVVNIDELVGEQGKKPVYSIIEWVKGIVNDLGLGFGWAAFYFTVVTVIWRGQTLGKKLLKIKVLQLDGTPLSMWDSFGRYGGYGAGLATGLLGFIQIYWDANRQAIHDKISSTVVIDLTLIDSTDKSEEKH